MRYAKFFVAAAGIGVLIGLQQFQVEIPGLPRRSSSRSGPGT